MLSMIALQVVAGECRDVRINRLELFRIREEHDAEGAALGSHAEARSVTQRMPVSRSNAST